MNSTFQSFVHSEVKTSHGFRLVEAYLSYKNLEEGKREGFSDFEIVEEPAKKAPRLTAEPAYTTTSSFQEMPADWASSSPEVAMDHRKPAPAPHFSPIVEKKISTYKVLSGFSPKGQKIDTRF